MRICLRGALLGLAAATVFPCSQVIAQQPAVQPAEDRLPGQLNEAQLGQVIAALGIKPEKQEQRYDFAFRAKMGEAEWELSMSSVLSRDEKSIWLMAWLDPLPESADDVPRNALLRLLAKNDEIGNGKFFAYVPSNRRFVLQRVVSNSNMTSAKFKYLLQDLGTSVVDTYGTWSVSSWTQQPGAEAAQAAEATQPAAAQQPVIRSAEEPNFQQPIRR